jgi:hypothetical protein
MSIKKLSILTVGVITGTTLAVIGLSNLSYAESGSGSGGNNLARCTGIIKSRPAGKVGTWTLQNCGSFKANNATELDLVPAGLKVGTCAKVRYFPNRVADEIDSEPLRDCN